MLRKLIIDLGTIVMMRTLTGVLPRILRRMQGLQHIEFRLVDGWDEYEARQPDGNATFGQGFLRLVKKELGHVKTIIINEKKLTFEDEDVGSWMAFELLKRNKAWVPPSSTCDCFCTTSSPFQYFSREIISHVLDREYCLRARNPTNVRGYLEDKFGVF